MIDLIINILFIWMMLGLAFFGFVGPRNYYFEHNKKELLFMFLSGPILWLLYLGLFVYYVCGKLREWFEK